MLFGKLPNFTVSRRIEEVVPGPSETINIYKERLSTLTSN